jgi:hypothetical protein
MARERPLRHVPMAVWVGLSVLMAAQVFQRLANPVAPPVAADLPAAPSPAAVRALSLGDPQPVAKLLMLYLQSFDYQSGTRVPFQALDYQRLEQWLRTILVLDPKGQYPLMAAARVYAEVPDADKKRRMLDFVYEQFLLDPILRWPWLAHAAAIAKHQLNDLPRARRYAHAIQQYAGADSPAWARQMEAFIAEDMDELETARIMIGGFIASGQVSDPAELRLLDQRLREIERRLRAPK